MCGPSGKRVSRGNTSGPTLDSSVDCRAASILLISRAAATPTLHAYQSALRAAGIIPGALGIDPRPIPCADGDDALGVVDEKQPCLSAGFDDRLVAVPDEAAQFVASEIIPDVLHRVQFR